MFDWDDQELTNIIWDEAGKTDDHTVPYPKEVEERASGLYGDHVKQGYNEKVSNSKPTEENESASRGNLTGVIRERPSQNENIQGISTVGYDMDSWPDLSSSHGVKTVQNPLGVEVSGVAKENPLKDAPAFSSDEVSQLDNGLEIFLNEQEEKEQIGSVDYGWASIGSFDDLDRIFSNDDPMFGSLGNTDQIWSSSKDITSVPVKEEFLQDLDQPYAHPCGEMIFLTSQDQENLHAIDGQIDHAGGNCQPVAKEKVGEEKKIFKSREKIERGLDAEGPLLQDSYSFWYDGDEAQQFGQIVPSTSHNSSPSALKQQALVQGPWSAHYQQPSNSNSFRETHSLMENTSVKAPTMTPQEKIEKLRRRQQMQALLAIQEQRKQLNHQQLIAPNPSGEKYDSNTISAEVNDYHSMEEIILHQLQGVVAQLDTKIRLCIRDSLFRLAQSAMQRRHAGDTSRPNVRKDDTVSDNRCLEKADVVEETETNPTDRTVAHLLFHRPLESSETIHHHHVQTPESSLKLETNAARGGSPRRGWLPERGERQQQTCHGHGGSRMAVLPPAGISSKVGGPPPAEDEAAGDAGTEPSK